MEILLPAGQVSSFEAGMEASFHQPLTVVADGQIVDSLTPEPNLTQYQPIGGVLIVYAAGSEIQRIANEIAS